MVSQNKVGYRNKKAWKPWAVGKAKNKRRKRLDTTLKYILNIYIYNFMRLTGLFLHIYLLNHLIFYETNEMSVNFFKLMPTKFKQN